MTSRFFTRTAALLALLSVLLATSAPTVSSVLRAGHSGVSGAYVLMCSADGVHRVLAKGVNGVLPIIPLPQVPSSSVHDGQCPFCHLQTGSPPVDRRLRFEYPEHRVFVSYVCRSPRPLLAWVLIPARAPPAVV